MSKPISRLKFLLGKYFGLLYTLLVIFLIMSIVLYFVLFFFENRIDLVLLKGVILIYFEMGLMIAFATLFSTFSTPTLSAVYSIIVYIIGHLSKEAFLLTRVEESKSISGFIKAIYYIFPNLENFNIKTELVYHLHVPDSKIILSILYGIGYSAIVLLLAIYIFSKRDLK